MFSQLRPAFVLLVWFTLITGVAYPVAVTGIARLVFPQRAEGSLIVRDGRTVGSKLIGQEFSDPGHFWGRLSATGPVPYNASASTGSNFGPMNPALLAAVKSRVAALRAAGSDSTALVPVDLVTASASGLDPEISPAAAEYQVERVARARAMAPEDVRALVLRHTSPRQFGVLGEPRVNVLALNLELDQGAAGR